MSDVLFVVGSSLILHAAYSCLHYRGLLQELEESAVNGGAAAAPDLPIDVLLEVAMGFVSLLISEMIRPGSALRPISSPHQTLMAPSYRSRDFDIYTTRAKVL